MANIVTQLQNKSGDNLYPLAGGMAANSIETAMVQDGAVTAAKLDGPSIFDTVKIGPKNVHVVSSGTTQSVATVPVPSSSVCTLVSAYFDQTNGTGTAQIFTYMIKDSSSNILVSKSDILSASTLVRGFISAVVPAASGPLTVEVLSFTDQDITVDVSAVNLVGHTS